MNNIYVKLAGNNLKNNKTLYVPYLISGIITVMMFYIMMFLNNSKDIKNVPGVFYVSSIMAMGVVIIGIFSYIFIFYTNSFIIKRRKREIGIYNILGMEKRHIAKVLGLETIAVAVLSIFGGIAIGILFSKMSVMLIYRLLHVKQTIRFEIVPSAVENTVLVFGILYLLTLVYNLMQIRLANPVTLLRSGNTGEKEPKTKWVMAVLGVVCLGVAYYLAITIEQPMKVLALFFVAVLLVMVGTYLLFTAGSIAVLKLLRKSHKFYYHPKHFTAVSGMLYRMKQNAAGLASICILSTMVLVVVSTTVSMFLGMDDELRALFPQEINVSATYRSVTEQAQKDHESITDIVEKNGQSVKHTVSYSYLNFDMMEQDKEYVMSQRKLDTSVFFLTKENFLKMCPKLEKSEVADVTPGKILVFRESKFYKKHPLHEKELRILGKTFEVQAYKECPDENQNYDLNYTHGSYYMVVDSKETLQELLKQVQEDSKEENKYSSYAGAGCSYQDVFGIDITGTSKEKIACGAAVKNYVKQLQGDTDERISYSVQNREENRKEVNALYGGLFFLGAFLGIVFLAVTVMIIFYKQLSEGFDDRERYRIMEQVGMSNEEVKASINAQIRMVFFLPIVTAAIHVTAAFPMIRRLLSMLNLTNNRLFTGCVIATVGVFAIIYYMVFRMTSRTYYKIVRNQVR